MSDTTTLIHDYEVSRQLAERMNRASLAMKRARRHGAAPGDLVQAREAAAKAIAQVLHLLQPAAEQTPGGVGDREIPEGLIEDLRERYGSQMPYLLKDIADAIKSLSAGEISDAAIDVIDKLCQSADSVASASFRKLRRR